MECCDAPFCVLLLCSFRMPLSCASAATHLRLALCSLSQTHTPMSTARYGSAVTDLGTCDSDIDVTVLVPSSNDITTEAVHTALHEAADTDPRFLPHRVVGGKCPVLVLEHNPTRIRIEISVRNRLSLCNTALQRAYLALNPIAAPLVHTARAWFETQRRIKVSAYATTLAVLGYLQSIGSLPNLQQRHPECTCVQHGSLSISGDGSPNTTEQTVSAHSEVGGDRHRAKRARVDDAAAPSMTDLDEWDTWFCTCGASQVPQTLHLSASVGLVAGWFDFLAARCSGDAAISVRCGGVAMLDDVRCDRTSLIIEDPFELTHNVSRSVTAIQASVLAKAAVRITTASPTHVFVVVGKRKRPKLVVKIISLLQR